VTVLPWHNPVRVAEDVNMLDAFLGAGREIICGVGRGLGRREYAGLGIDQARPASASTSRSRCCASCGDRHLRLRRKHYQIHGLRLRPSPNGTSPQPVVRRRHGRTVAIIAATTCGRSPFRHGGLTSRWRRAKVARLSREAATAANTKLALWTYVADKRSPRRAAAPSSRWSSTPIRAAPLRAARLRTSPT